MAAVEGWIYLLSCKSTPGVFSISGSVACVLPSNQPDEYLCNKPYIITLHVYCQQKKKIDVIKCWCDEKRKVFSESALSFFPISYKLSNSFNPTFLAFFFSTIS